jgi:hypothetical protein
VPHNHHAEEERIVDARHKGLLSLMSLSDAAREYDEKVCLKVEMIQDDMIQ